MIPLAVRMVIVFVVGVCLGSLVNWAIYTFAWHPRPTPRFGVRPLSLKIGLGLALAGLYWWEVGHLGLISGQLGGLAVAPPSGTLHLQFSCHALLLCWMLAASFIDIDEKIIPDEITVSGTLLGLVLATLVPMSLLPHVAERPAQQMIGRSTIGSAHIAGGRPGNRPDGRPALAGASNGRLAE